MGDGMKRAALAAIITQGPWRVMDEDRSRTTYTTLDAADVAALYYSIRAGLDGSLVGRLRARALQLLRSAGLVEYTGKPKKWRVTGSLDEATD